MSTDKPIECQNCDLYELGKGFLSPEGSGSIPLLMVGESAGYNELLDSLPFRPQAPAGSMLERVINRTRFRRNEFALWNLIGCHPPADQLAQTSYEYESINHCRVHFDRVIHKYRPKVILALGSLPLKHLTGFGEGKGKEEKVSLLRGYVLPCSRYPDIKVIASYHPSFLRRGNSKYMGLAILDLMKAINLAQGKLVEGRDYIIDPMSIASTNTTTIPVTSKNYAASFGDLFYYTNPTAEGARDFLRYVRNNPEALIAYDIETEKSAGKEEDELEEYGNRITQIQFSLAAGSGIAFPFVEPFVSISRQIFETQNPKSGHNVWKFDNPILNRAGFKINGRIDDTMWMFHHFQADLPLGLQSVACYYNFPFPWKHYAGSDLAFYGCADVDSVMRIMQRLPDDLKKRDLWKGYDRYVYQLEPILVRMSERGIPINQKKQSEFGLEIDKRKLEIEKELVSIVPEDLLKFKEYKKEPKSVRLALDRWEKDFKERTSQGAIAYALKDEDVVKEGIVRRQSTEKVGSGITGLISDGTAVGYEDHVSVERWFKVEPFNCNSWQQIQKYIKHRGHAALAKKAMNKVKREAYEDDDFSTSKEVLNRLYIDTGEIFYKLVVEYKELSKVKSSYLSKHWEPDSTGKVHADFTFRPATGQLSAVRPAVQTIPAHSGLAKKLRDCIEAQPNHVLIKFDKKSFHAQTMAFEAKSAAYLRLARSDIHSYVAAHMMKISEVRDCLSWSDSDLINFLKGMRVMVGDARQRAKVVILGMQLGLTVEGCYTRFREDFNPTPDEAQNAKKRRVRLVGEALQKEIQRLGKLEVTKIFNLYKELFPEIIEWQEFIKHKADSEAYLDSRWGFRRWFWCVFEYTKAGSSRELVLCKYCNRKHKNGEQSEDAISFLVQNGAHGMMREQKLYLEESGYLEKYGLINTVHDDLWFHCPKEFQDDAMENVKRVMDMPCSVLTNELCPEGLAVEVDCKIGKSMFSLEEVKL